MKGVVMGVKRYDMTTVWSCGDYMSVEEPSEDGYWVTYEDHEKVVNELQDKIDELIADRLEVLESYDR